MQEGGDSGSLLDPPVPGKEAAGSWEVDVDLHADFQEYRAALECELCRWRVPSDGIDIASVVEVSPSLLPLWVLLRSCSLAHALPVRALHALPVSLMLRMNYRYPGVRGRRTPGQEQ